MRPKILSQNLKAAVEKAFDDAGELSKISVADREIAARFYEAIAETARGSKAALARLYNLERAKFLRGKVARITPTAIQFAKEHGLS